MSRCQGTKKLSCSQDKQLCPTTKKTSTQSVNACCKIINEPIHKTCAGRNLPIGQHCKEKSCYGDQFGGIGYVWKSSGSVSGDYFSYSKIGWFSIQGSAFKIYPLSLKIEVDKGKIIINPASQAQYQTVNSNSSLYTMVSGGIYYCTGVPSTHLVFKRNIPEFSSNINLMVTMASSYLVNNNTSSTKKLNALWKARIGFTTNDYNFYTSDYYSDYYTTHNGYAYDCIRIVAQIVFSWHLIHNLAKSYGILIDFWFYQTFYTCIFENLYSTTPILSKQFNVYFDKYHLNFVPESYNSIINKWITLINSETDVVKIIICKQASYALTIEELEAFDITKLFETYSYMTVKFKFLDCLNFNSKPAPTSLSKPNTASKTVSNTASKTVSKTALAKNTNSKSITENKSSDINTTSLENPVFVMYYSPRCGHCVRALPEFNKIVNNTIKILPINVPEYEDKEFIKSQGINAFPVFRFYPNGLKGTYEGYKGARTMDSFNEFLSTK